jgi:hypothetical protein
MIYTGSHMCVLEWILILTTDVAPDYTNLFPVLWNKHWEYKQLR